MRTDGTGFSPRRTSAPCFSSPTATLPRGPGSGCLRGAFGRFPPLHHWVRRNRASIRRGFFRRRSKVKGRRSLGAARRPPSQTRTQGGAGAGGGEGFHTMESGFPGFSTQWKHVSRIFPHNGSMFRALFQTMETCFAAGFHGVENAGDGPPRRSAAGCRASEVGAVFHCGGVGAGRSAQAWRRSRTDIALGSSETFSHCGKTPGGARRVGRRRCGRGRRRGRCGRSSRRRHGGGRTRSGRRVSRPGLSGNAEGRGKGAFRTF